MHLRMILAALAAGFSGTISADSIDINLNDDSIQAIYATNWRAAEFNTGLLTNTDQNDWAAHIGLLALGEKQTGNTRIEGGLGGRIYLADVANQDVLALGLGGQVRSFPNNGPVGIAGYLYYAPDIVTSMDGEKFWEWGARVEFEMVKRTANVYLGYRKMRADLDNGRDITLDSGLHAGVKIIF
ncbi:MAG: YfaZ family protein [Gammaproteobacteria bacterium]|nr:YfaZ family protein [Gammaproteobacteria bacterium]MDH5511912.1 YfaZ family protein [Gammaproteobacteria bacterium]